MESIQWNILKTYNLRLQSVRKEFLHNLKTLNSEALDKAGHTKEEVEVVANKWNYDLNKQAEEIDLQTSNNSINSKLKTKHWRPNYKVYKTNWKGPTKIEKPTKYSVKLVREQWRELIKLNLCMLLLKLLMKLNHK